MSTNLGISVPRLSSIAIKHGIHRRIQRPLEASIELLSKLEG
jgi:hypothetical protein